MAGRISYYGGIVKDGLILDLDAAKKDSYAGSGTVWNDLSGISNNGTLVNGPTFSSANGGSIVFDGTNDYVNCGNMSSLLLSNNQFTVSYWLKPTTTNRIDFFNIKNFNSPQDDIGFFIDVNKFTVYFKIQGNSTGTGLSTSIATITTGLIYNLVCVKNASQQIVQYINGVFDNNTNSSLFNTSTVALTSLWIGANRSNATTPAANWQGNIYNTQLYNRALSATEITQNYNALKSRFGL
jgi:hypothetical protein